MIIDNNSEKPIFIQFAEFIEDSILKGVYEEETQLPSTTEVAISLKINPATANRGINILVDDGIAYKKRGIGMFVCVGARERIKNKRKLDFYNQYLQPLIKEAMILSIDKKELIKMIEKEGSNE